MFEVNSQDIKQPIGIQATVMSEIKFQKHIFQQIMTIFLEANVSFLNPC